MTIQAPQVLNYNIDKDFASNFDELIDIILEPRKSDIWFSDETQMMIAPRPWTVRVWNVQVWSWWTKWQFFFLDNHSNKFHIKAYNNKVYYLKNWTWEDIWWTFTWSQVNFNTVLVPFNENHSIPTTFTAPTDASESEMVKADPLDIWWANNINKVIIILDDAAWQQTHRWIFWLISWYDAIKREYKIWWSWIISPVKSWATYKIYDILAEHLQISDWASLDKYYFSNWTDLIENTPFVWLATYWLRTIWALTSSWYLFKQVEYNFKYWTWSRWILFFSKWYTYWNPFYYSATSIYTLWTSWSVNWLYNWKWRLIVWLNNSIMALTPTSVTDTWVQLYKKDYISTKFWMKTNSFLDLWDDWYYLSTNWTAFSLSETINNTITTTNIWKPVRYYLNSIVSNICAWYDWRYLYFYWQPDSNTMWTMLVFDVWYKFWATFTNLRPSSIVFDDWITYIWDNNSDIIRKFDKDTIWLDVTTSWTTKIHQRVATKDVDLWDVFSIKQLRQAYLWLENYTQTVLFDVFMWLADNAAKKQTKVISITETVNKTWNSWILWGNIVWWEILWWFWFDENISFIRIKRIKFQTDKAYLWKFMVRWKNDWVFYLNALSADIWFMQNRRRYMAAWHTI